MAANSGKRSKKDVVGGKRGGRGGPRCEEVIVFRYVLVVCEAIFCL